MRNGWTGGQYSLFRLIFGAYLLIHFAHLVPWGAELFSNRGVLPDASASPLVHAFPNILAWFDGPEFVATLLVFAALLSFLFAIGFADRTAAVLLWYIWACLYGRNPLISNPGLPFVGWLLLAHAFLPKAPYGSLAAVGRLDPGNNWRMPQAIFVVAWILMAAGYTYSGLTKLASPSWVDGTALARVLENPLARPGWLREALLALPDLALRLGTWGALALEIGFLPLLLFRRLRPWAWLLMLFMHFSLMSVLDFTDLSLGMVMMHLFTFNPAWIPGARGQTGVSGPPDMVFYDGHCGLCHRFVRFVLAEDRTERFRFAPLQGGTFQSAVPESERANLPDSVVVRTIDGRLLIRSAATLHVLGRLGGAWRLMAMGARIIPRVVRDGIYDGVARIRYRLFGRPADMCPIIPKALRTRFAD